MVVFCVFYLINLLNNLYYIIFNRNLNMPIFSHYKKHLGAKKPYCCYFLETIRFSLFNFPLNPVVINQASLQDNLSFLIRQFTKRQFKLRFPVFSHNVCLDGVSLFFNCLSNARYIDIIKVFEWELTFLNQEWQHSPVNQVRTITLGRILICDIRPSAKHLLAARRLFPCRAVVFIMLHASSSSANF